MSTNTKAVDALGDLEKILQLAGSLNNSTGALSAALQLSELANKFKNGNFRTGEPSMFAVLIEAARYEPPQ